jgi:hypothetical protein
MRGCRSLAALAAYTGAAVLCTWPLAAHVRSRLPAAAHPSNYNDALYLAWALSWDVHQLLRDPLRIFEANIFHPLRHTLAYSEAMLAQALLVLPLAPLTPAPVLLHNTVLLLTFALGGWGAFLLLRHLTGSPAAAFVGGLVFAFCPYRFAQIARLHVLAVHWTPFLFLALHRYLEAPGRWRAAALAGAVVLQALASVYVAYSSVLLVAVFLAGWALAGPAPARVRRALGAGAVFAVGAGIVAVAYLPYALVRAEMQLARDPGQVIVHSVLPAELGDAVTGMPAYLAGKLATGARGGGTLGAAASVLALAGLVWGGTVARLYGLVALAALVLSFGPVLFLPWGGVAWVPGPYRLLQAVVPGFAALREPSRFLAFAAACGALVAGLGAAALLARVRSAGRRALAAGAMVVAIAFEAGWHPLALTPAPLPGPAARLYAAMAADPAPGAVIELPLGGLDRRQAIATFRSAYHLRPLVNGYTGFRPALDDVHARVAGFPGGGSVSFLERLGVRYVVYDTTRPYAPDPPALAAALAAVAPAARVRGEAGGTVLIELAPQSAPAAFAVPGTPLRRKGWTVRASAPGAEAVLDGDRGTHWTARVTAETGPAWLEVDLGAARDVDCVTVELGPHFAEYPRAWRVEAWTEGEDGRIVGERRAEPAPLLSYRSDHRRLAVHLRIRPVRARRLRVTFLPPAPRSRRVAAMAPAPWGWDRVGVHELELYRLGGVPPGG